MHTDENKTFDKRNIERKISDGIISRKDYEIYLSKLPDASDKAFNAEEALTGSEDTESKREDEAAQAKKRAGKKKVKAKGK